MKQTSDLLARPLEAQTAVLQHIFIHKAELKEMWQHLLTEQCQGKRPYEENDNTRKDELENNTDLTQVVKQMANLLIRHEDLLAVMKHQDEFIIHMNLGVGSVAPMLMEASRKWHKEQPKPGPLRQMMSLELISSSTF